MTNWMKRRIRRSRARCRYASITHKQPARILREETITPREDGDAPSRAKSILNDGAQHPRIL